MNTNYRILSLTTAALATVSASAQVVITPSYDVSFTSQPNFAALQTTVNSALSIYSSRVANNLTIPIIFTLDNAISGAQSSYSVSPFSFSSYRSALSTAATTATDATVLANIGAGPNDPVLNVAQISLPDALSFALGLGSAQANYGTVSFNLNTYKVNPAGFLGVIQHEVNEVLGTASSLPNGTGGATLPITIAPSDLFRYTSAGARSFTLNNGNDSANKAFFRLSSGGANLQEWNNLPNGGDYGDWAANGSFPAAPQDQAGDSNTFTSMAVSTAELSLLDAIGYSVVAVPEPVETATFTAVALAGLMIWRRQRTR